MEYAELLIQMTNASEVDHAMVEAWKNAKKSSLYSSFNQADGSAIIPWRENLEDQIRVSKFMQAMMSQVPVQEALDVFGGNMRKTEQKLLRILTDNAGTTLSRDTLLDRIWTDGGEYVDENALSVTIKRLRDKLSAKDSIKTVYGIGYMWGKKYEQ